MHRLYLATFITVVAVVVLSACSRKEDVGACNTVAVTSTVRNLLLGRDVGTNEATSLLDIVDVSTEESANGAVKCTAKYKLSGQALAQLHDRIPRFDTIRAFLSRKFVLTGPDPDDGATEGPARYTVSGQNTEEGFAITLSTFDIARSRLLLNYLYVLKSATTRATDGTFGVWTLECDTCNDATSQHTWALVGSIRERTRNELAARLALFFDSQNQFRMYLILPADALDGVDVVVGSQTQHMTGIDCAPGLICLLQLDASVYATMRSVPSIQLRFKESSAALTSLTVPLEGLDDGMQHLLQAAGLSAVPVAPPAVTDAPPLPENPSPPSAEAGGESTPGQESAPAAPSEGATATDLLAGALGHDGCAQVASTDGILTVRSGPGANFDALGELKSGDVVEFEDCSTETCSGDWRVVKHVVWTAKFTGIHPLQGWVNAHFLQPTGCED
jgi:hypothetical protein